MGSAGNSDKELTQTNSSSYWLMRFNKTLTIPNWEITWVFNVALCSELQADILSLH